MNRAPRNLVGLLLVAGGLLLPFQAVVEAQVVRGRVLDSSVGEPVATARVTLLTGEGERVATVLSDALGRFTVRTTSAGPHILEADRLGYGPQRTEPFDVAPEGVTVQDVLLRPEAVELEGIVVQGYPGQLMHEATMAGVYARRARSASVGSNRVIVRGEGVIENHFRVRDVLPAWIPGPRCVRKDPQGDRIPWIYFNGWEAATLGPRGGGNEKWVLDLSVTEVLALEFYRDINQVPMSMRPPVRLRVDGFDQIRACGVVAVWTHGAPR